MPAIDRLTAAIAAAGAFAGASAWLLGGLGMGNGALVGALVVYVNWVALRWLLARMLQPGSRKGPVVTLLVLKMAAVFAVCWVLVVRVGVDGLGFALGLTALPVGLVLGAALDPQRDQGSGRDRPRSPDHAPRAGRAEG